MCCFVGSTSFKDLEKSKGQAKAMISSWSVETTETKDSNTLKEVVGSSFYTDKNTKNNVTTEQFKENMWIFGGMRGFRK